MQVTLINPKLNTWSPNVYAPLGLAYIAAALEDAGHSVNIVDMNSRRISDDKLIKQINDADVIGIGGLITEYKEVVRLTEVIAHSYPATYIVLGGALATTHTEKVLEKSQADFAVRGEGEISVVELLTAIEQGGDYSTIKGIAYKTDKVYVNPMRDPIQDLDTVKFPARYLLNMSRYSTHHFKTFGIKVPNIKSTTMISSRGCPYICEFCFKDYWGGHWRGRSPENMIAEIKELHENYGFKGFVFNDDTFVMNRKRALEFCRLLIESKMDVVWYCNGRVNLMDEELISAMALSGCKGIAYGIESGNQAILDAVKKRITLEQIEKITSLTKKYGIHVTGYFMIGILGDTKETINQTIKFARKLDLDFYGFGITSPIIGTEMYRKAVEQGVVVSEDLQDWSFHAAFNMTKDCTREDLEKFNEDAFREFTIEKRYGKHYLFNPFLWWSGLRSILFLMGKRDFRGLIKKAWQVVRK